MDLAAFSPRKQNLLPRKELSTRPLSAHKRTVLFPSDSPPRSRDDLGLISQLSSDDSDVYSPPPTSPSLSTPDKDDHQRTFRRVLGSANHLVFGEYSPNKQVQNSPKRSPRNKVFGKENMDVSCKTTRKTRKSLMERDNFHDCFDTILPDVTEKIDSSTKLAMKSNDIFNTPKRPILIENKWNECPEEAKHEIKIKPVNFYGRAAPLLATNQTNRIQGMKCVFRPTQPSKAKAKLLFEEKPIKKRERSRSSDVIREAKKRKTIFTGVHHAIPKPVKRSASDENEKHESIREKARKKTDLSRTPYGMKKGQKATWEYTLRFTKPLRYEESENSGEKRKFFKTILKESPSLYIEQSLKEDSSTAVAKKRKLLDPTVNYLEEPLSQEELGFNVTDISNMIDDLEAEKIQEKPEVDDILLRLEEEDEEEKKKEAERQMLMNILEDSPTKFTIESLSNCTASLDLNDSTLSGGSGCSRFSLEDKENESTPRKLFSMFGTLHKRSSAGNSKQGSSSKKKWQGLGEEQLQIDAGQKKFGAFTCTDCGMIYQLGEAEDEMQHKAFHHNLSCLRHPGWKNENIVGRFGLDYIIVITGDDSKPWQQKALDVIAVVDKSLGITTERTNIMHNQKVFLYVADKCIVGCMVASPINKAYKLISSESDVDVCSEESYPVRCGISRMWTFFSYRRKGVATNLLDTVRRNFMYGYILAENDIAFSIPTPDGKQFATKYMKSPNFHVYTGFSN